MMEVSEFQFFELAHERWYGRRARARFVEAMFEEYMLRESVPPWVRHLARQVLTLEERGALCLEHFGLAPPAVTVGMRIQGVLLAVGLLLLLVVFCLLVSGYVPF